MLTKDY